MLMEIWKKVKPIKLKTGEVYKPYGYEVSNLGRVRSYKNKYGYGPRKLLSKPVIVNGRPDPSGYIQYQMSDKNGLRKNIRGHVIVATTFIGSRKNNMDVCHKDGVKSNNSLKNLRYDTHKNNLLDNKK